MSKMKLHNKTIYNYKAIINGTEYYFNKGDIINFEYSEKTKVELKCLKKPSVHLDWLTIIFLQMFFGSTTITNIYADYSFVISSDECEIIEIKYNDWTPREQININTCYADADVTDEEYKLPLLEKVRKKHKNLHLFISNALPLGIACLVLCFFMDPPTLFIILFIVWLLLFELPGLKEIKRFKQIMKPDLLNEKLCEYAVNRRKHNYEFNEDLSRTGKFVQKIINKMFKFDEDKK